MCAVHNSEPHVNIKGGSLWHQLPVAGPVPVYPSHRHPVFTSTCGSAASTRWGGWWWETIPPYNRGSWGTGHQEWGYSLLDPREAEVKFSFCVTLCHSETCIMRPVMCAFGITRKGPQQYLSSVVGSHIWTQSFRTSSLSYDETEFILVNVSVCF